MAPHLSTTDMISPAAQPTIQANALAHGAPAHAWQRWLLPATGIVGLIATVALAAYYREPIAAFFEAPPPRMTSLPAESVTILSPGLVSVAHGTPLEQRLHVTPVLREELEYPLLNVTGFVMARLAPGADQAESRWDFASPEVATAYADWLNARADVLVFEKQADKTRELVNVQVKYLKAELERKEKYFPSGTVPERDLVAAKADYLKADIQGQKDITDAESNLKKAVRNRGLLERQLFQAGVDPEVVRKATEGLVLVVADVPEANVELVKVGQPCEARFFGVPSEVFKGRVGRLGPSLAKEKRTLRVTFELTNPAGKLLPGMFAEIGLGTESRKVLTVPTEAVLHAGRCDYVMKEESPGKYRAVEVKVDEPRQITHAEGSVSCIPLRDGVHEGDRVVGAGSILLKPILVKSLAHANGAATH